MPTPLFPTSRQYPQDQWSAPNSNPNFIPLGSGAQIQAVQPIAKPNLSEEDPRVRAHYEMMKAKQAQAKHQSQSLQSQAVQQQVAAYASGNYPPQQPQHHQYGQQQQYGAGADYSNSYYGAYGSAGGQEVGGAGQQPKTDYNW